MILNEIVEAITTSRVHLDTRETDREAVLRYRVNGVAINCAEVFLKLQMIHVRDNYSISIAHEGTDQNTVLSEKGLDALVEFNKRLQLWSETDDGVVGVLTLRVTKAAIKKSVTIYSLDYFSVYLQEGTVGEVLKKVNSLSSAAYIIECQEISETYRTGLFVFKPLSLETSILVTNPEVATKAKRIEQRDKVCSIYGGVRDQYLPNDFRFDRVFCHKVVQDIFQKLELLYSLISLSDVSKFEVVGTLSIVLKGYSNVKLEIKTLANIDVFSAIDFFEIFEWVYTDGNIVDKIGISRNIISIHVIDDNLFRLKAGCIESITSNYIIYLKDNLKQYVEVKNKLSDQIQKTSEKAAEVVKSINTYLRASIFSVYSFVFTVFWYGQLVKPILDRFFLMQHTPFLFCLFLFRF
ncbi:hypothetical protein [Pseudomonas fluorescens]|uniref:hypothetical protein n=1 Tax=Pseudomonas fluorescens TaxID=294 RepID=UPI00034D4022|nr:hypothetical protein [Pseudomonas fluorescens]